MSRFRFCALALAGCASCADVADGYVGSYSVTGLTNILTIEGKTMIMPLTIPSGFKLDVRNFGPVGIELSLAAKEFANADCPSAPSNNTDCQTIARTDRVTDGDCTFTSSWRAGGLVSLGQTGLLVLRRKGDVTALCTGSSSSFTNASGEQTLHAQRDR